VVVRALVPNEGMEHVLIPNASSVSGNFGSRFAVVLQQAEHLQYVITESYIQHRWMFCLDTIV
jgi:hypothetical protein